MHGLTGFSILLVDDHPLFREGLVTALRHQAPGLQLQAAGTAEQAAQALAAPDQSIDLVLLDYCLPGLDGLRCAQQLMEQHPLVGFGLLSGLDDPTLPARARAAGLQAYLSKSLELPELLRRLQQLAQGLPCFDAPSLALAPPAPGLTARQQAVLGLLASGASNKEIARALDISPATVKNHLEAIFSRLGASNRMQAVMLAHEHVSAPH